MGDGTKCNIEVQRADNDDQLKRVRFNASSIIVTDVSELMSCFKQKQVNNSKFPIFSNRMDFLKNAEGGLNAVCEVMERYEKIAAEKAAEKANIRAVISMITTFHATKAQILKLYSEDEYNQAMEEINKNI